jgi:predicted PurR-regulated permease PerM
VLKNFTGELSSLILSIPQLLLAAFVALMMMFFILKEGPALLEWLKRLLPLEQKHKEEIYTKFNAIIYGVLYGFVFTGLLQGALGGFGFWIFGFSNPVFWGIIMTIASFLPILGTTFVWLPAAIIQITAGSAIGDQTLLWYGIGLIAYGLILIKPIDWILKPYLIGSHAKAHTLVIMIGVIGGIFAFGPAGVILGPLLLALLKTLLDIYEREIRIHGRKSR